MRAVASQYVFVGSILLVLSASAPARAQQACETYCSNYSEGQCSAHETKCTDIAPPRPSYGAIAYGRKSGAYGFSYKWDSQSKAEGVAMQNCAKNGSDCEVMVWFDRKCGAVAAPRNSAAAYWGLGDGAGDANSHALRQCTKDGGKNCEVKVSQCSR
jgi:hypothetical protein